ncbi:MAG: hypothetical protein E7170_03970 [Firmicutes bacterium]|nr:hypothetical protein [Bacillota bacterium]
MHFFEQVLIAYKKHCLTDFLKGCSLSELEYFRHTIYANDITDETYEIIGTINQELEYRSCYKQQKKK